MTRVGLVCPSARTAAGYRAYSAGDVERLREVLAYRRLGFGLREIADLVDDPAADAVVRLHRLRVFLVQVAFLAVTERVFRAARRPPLRCLLSFRAWWPASG
jgi:DNA-binding transcriptional MerR regulator